MPYAAPDNVSSAWGNLSPDQQKYIASSIGFDWNPGQNDTEFNSFVQSSPSAFESKVLGFQPTEPSGFDPSQQQQSPQTYSAPQNVQSAWDTLSPQQQQQTAQQSGFNWTPGQNDSAFNSFVAQSPGAFESNVLGLKPTWGDPSGGNSPQVLPAQGTQSATSNRYAAPAWAQGVWDQLQPWQQTQVAHQTGYTGTGQQSAFNDYVQQNNKAGDFESILGTINPQTFGQNQARTQVPQGANPYQFDSGFGYSVPAQGGSFAPSSYGSMFGQNSNFLSATPSAQTDQAPASAFAPHDYGAQARGSFQFRRGGRVR